MARGNNKKPGVRQSNVQYLNVDLTKAHKAELAKWAAEHTDIFDMIDKSVDSGLRFSCGYDSYNDCFMASLAQLPTGDKNTVTIVLVGRGADLLHAMQALFFKYGVILQMKLEDGDIQNPRGVTDWG